MNQTLQLQGNLNSVADNMMSLHDYLVNSYTEKKKKFTEDVSLFKEGLFEVIDRTTSCLTIFSLPVNNFLKDLGQIEKEFQEELTKSGEHFICLQGEMVSANDVLSIPMEENY